MGTSIMILFVNIGDRMCGIDSGVYKVIHFINCLLLYLYLSDFKLACHTENKYDGNLISALIL